MSGDSSAIGLIARREIHERLRSTSYRVVTALLVVAIVAIGVVARIAADDDEPAQDVVGVAGTIPDGFDDTVGSLAQATDREVTVVTVEPGEVRSALEDSDVDAVIVADDDVIMFDGEVDETLQAVVQQAWAGSEVRQALVDSGATGAEADDLLSPTALTAETLDGDDDELPGIAILTGSVTAILLFLSLQVFGNYALVGVAEEKSNAVVELLLVRVRADALLAGKLLGIGVAALGQFAAAVLAALAALGISGAEVPADIWSAVPLATLWFLGGYALYSTLFALAGSLVSRQEDAQAAAAPILSVLVAAYMLVYIVGYVPDALVTRILSVLPPIAPFLMPMRMAAGSASVLEIVLALVLLVGTTVLTWKISGRIYEQVLLRRGSRIPWREALALGRRG